MKQKSIKPTWHAYAGLSLICQKGERQLSVNMISMPTSSLWFMIAVEGAGPTKSINGSLNRMLDDHGHENLGAFPLQEAMKKAEAYMNKWMAKKRAVSSCGCGPIRKGEVELKVPTVAVRKGQIVRDPNGKGWAFNGEDWRAMANGKDDWAD